MAKLLIFTVLAVVASVQFSYALDATEALNVDIRGQLNTFQTIQKEAGSGKYADDLKTVIELFEGALKSDSADEKNNIISTAPSHFSEDFNNWFAAKVEEANVNADIRRAIEFYKSLLTSDSKHEAEIKTAVSTLENVLKEADLKQKVEKFANLEKSFSPDFQKFIKEIGLPAINQRLQATLLFFGNILKEKDIQFADEIKALKAKTEAALESNVSVDDKSKVLQEVTFTDNKQLNEYLQKKNLEYS